MCIHNQLVWREEENHQSVVSLQSSSEEACVNNRQGTLEQSAFGEREKGEMHGFMNFMKNYHGAVEGKKWNKMDGMWSFKECLHQKQPQQQPRPVQ